MRTPDTGISACIVCCNEADKLGPCLASLAWVDEIIVMNLKSSDDSAGVAAAYDATVIEHAPAPVVEWVRNEVAAAARHDWILVLDPDERVAPGLPPLLRQAAERTEIDAVIIPRMNYDLGYPPTHPVQRYEPQLRMYRRSRVVWPTFPNTLPSVPEARLQRLPNRDECVLQHDRSRNIPEVLDRSVRYAPIQAQAMLDAGEQFSGRAMLRALGSTAYRQFFVGQAWRDGVPGFLRAGILVGFKFYVWAAFWQLSGAKRTEADDRDFRRLGVLAEAARLAMTVGTRTLHALRAMGRARRALARRASSAGARRTPHAAAD
jgi:(heptosyl)LPS beta-1,4-glucosyltransferase